MNYWEFLIQKEGDETWLPLETQQVEILEGRYRVVGHTSRLNVPVEIWVSQVVTSEVPPRERVRKRTAKTNDAGLVVLIPYTHLKPGQWEIKCKGLNSTDGQIAADWRYQVQLQVFAPTEEDGSSSEWPLSTAAPSAVATQETFTNETLIAQAQAQLQGSLQRLGQVDDVAAAAVQDSPYRIFLRQQAFLARQDQAMTIAGQVQSLSDGFPMQGAMQQDSQLWLRLQNPETAAVIMAAHRPLGLDRLPADFKVKIQLPASLKTRIVLGEVSLRIADSPRATDNAADGTDNSINNGTANDTEHEKTAQVLSIAAFTITAGIDQLLDEIANTDVSHFEEDAYEEGAYEENGAKENGAREDRSTLAAALLNPTLTTPAPAVGVTSPHQPPLIITEGTTNQAATNSAPSVPQHLASQPQALEEPKKPEEPKNLEESQRSPVSPVLNLPPMVAQPAQFMSNSIEDDDLETSQIAALLEDIDGDLASQAGDMSTLEPPGIEAALPPIASRPAAIHSSPSSPRNSELDSELDPNLDPDWDRETAFTYQNAQALDDEDNEQSRSLQQTKANLAFKSLKLKDHFWQRLSSLTHESHDEARQLAEEMKAAGVSRTRSPQNSAQTLSSNETDNRAESSSGESASLPSFQASPSPANWSDSLPANSEVVIYDPAPPAHQPPQSPKMAAAPSPQSPSPQPLQQQPLAPAQPPMAQPPMTQPVTVQSPTAQPASPFSSAFTATSPLQNADLPEVELPVISVPAGDLIAGGSVTITVRIRPSVYKPFIKLWMIDRQSRTLVGEPQLLTSLRPDTLGYLESSADLRVPMGCLDVQIAAIAVDMATQQESNKAIVNRHVVPANQGSNSLRNFNI